eukprot:TRINITY_DN11822_c0_g2_i1.p1 TRINITY_DN11822_c0_g2~~TRINITY_DN11822_c0_g2_i1.p1  ORF type:complete len:1549 (+),score=539.65 TRINITY_DN11822_c0_g2_i1:223-4647(+)
MEVDRWTDSVTPPALPPPGNDWGLQHVLGVGRVEVLREVSAALCSPDATQAATAAETLHRALAEPHLLQQISDKTLLEDLTPFAPFASAKTKPAPLRTPVLDKLAPRAADAMKRITDAATWDPRDKPYETWLGDVVCGLVGGNADPFLQHCATAAMVIPAAAQALLPLAFVDLCCTPRADTKARAAAAKLQRLFAAQANATIFPAAAAAPSAVRTVLRGVATVQQVLLEDVRRYGVLAAGSREGMQLAVPPGAVPDLLKALDFGIAAQGALACGAVATALRLAEHALERDGFRGLIALKEKPAAAGAAPVDAGHPSDALDRLLRDAMFGGKGTASTAAMPAATAFAGRRTRCNPTQGAHDPARGCADDAGFKQTLVDIASAAGDVEMLRGVADPADARFWHGGFSQTGEWSAALVCADAELQLRLRGGNASPAGDGVGVGAAAHVLRGAGLHGLLSIHARRQAVPGESLAARARASASVLSYWGADVADAHGAPALFDEALDGLRQRNGGRFHAAVHMLRAKVADALAARPAELHATLGQLACLQRLETGGEIALMGSARTVSDSTLRGAGLLPREDGRPALYGIAARTASTIDLDVDMGSANNAGGGPMFAACPQSAADSAMPTLLSAELFSLLGRRDLYAKAVGAAATGLASVGNHNAALGLLQRVRLEGGAGEACDDDALPAALRAVEAHVLRLRGDREKAVACLVRLARELQPAGTSSDPPGEGSFVFNTPGKSLRSKSSGLPVAGGEGARHTLLAGVLCTLGKWLGDDKSETRTNVAAGYLTPAAALAAGCGDEQQKSDVFFTLARFLDGVHAALGARATDAGDKAVEEARAKYQECYDYLQKNQGKLPLAKQRLIERTSHHFGVISSKALEDQERLEGDQDTYLLQAVKAYGIATLYSDRHDLVCTFRLAALWLQNDANDELHHHLTSFFGKLAAPHKFLPLAYQLVSRLATPTDVKAQAFQSALSVLLDRLVKAHPHHVLYHVSALANGDYLPDGTRFKEVFIADASKVSAATAILKRVGKSKSTGPLLAEMQRVVAAYIEFAFHPINKKEHVDGASIALPQGCKLRGLRDLKHAVVTSYDVPVDPGGDYSTVPRIVGFDASFTTAGGINLPKIIKCLGSDGVWHKQLVKGGQDDLRQDSVLEQIFGLCNALLDKQPEAQQGRGLCMRTYKVVPLSPTAGVVQWVQDTLPMGEWLLARSNPSDGAHYKYHPKDMTYREARTLLCRQGMSDDAKRDAFQQVCNRFAPVLHYFFLERFPHPEKWVAARTAYTRSTAVASMVGYVIGLGDRHAQNILLDTTSGEVVHIDLGVAFEKGKMLPVPELVPFRLTRDVVDGMGVTGVEGVFRRTAERTLGILRHNKELLETVVEVFIHDPLYNYSLDPALIIKKNSEFTQHAAAAKTKRPRGADKEEAKANPDAELALLRVSEKLDGYEDGESLSVEGQVNTLIRTASCLDTLALMYVGWAAFM